MHPFAALALLLFAANPPTSFAPGHIFVAVTDNTALVSAVQEYDRDGNFLRTLSLNGFGARRLAFGPDGRLYVARSFTVEAILPDGSSAQTFDGAGSMSPIALCFGPDGHLMVADSASDVVLELDAQDNVVRTIGAGSGLSAPQQLDFGADGHLYVASFGDGLVYEFDATGEKVRTWNGGGTLSGMRWIGFDAAGRFFVSGVQAVPLLFVLADDDSVAQTLSLGDMLSPPTQLGFDALGRVFYIRNPSQGSPKLVRMLADGTKTEFSTQGANWSPSSVVVSPWRFFGKLKGVRFSDGSAPQKVKGPVTLSFWPGEGRAMLAISPSPLADAAGGAHVFRGVVAHKGDEDFGGVFQGTLLSAAPRSGSSGRLQIRFASKSDSAFQGKPLKVRLLLSEPGESLDLKGTLKPLSS